MKNKLKKIVSLRKSYAFANKTNYYYVFVFCKHIHLQCMKKNIIKHIIKTKLETSIQTLYNSVMPWSVANQ